MPALYSMADGIFVGHFSGQDTDICFLSSVSLDRRMAVRISHRDGMPCSFSSHFLAGHFSAPLYLYFFYGRFVGIDRGLSDASCCRVFQCCYPGFYHTCKEQKNVGIYHYIPYYGIGASATACSAAWTEILLHGSHFPRRGFHIYHACLFPVRILPIPCPAPFSRIHCTVRRAISSSAGRVIQGNPEVFGLWD